MPGFCYACCNTNGNIYLFGCNNSPLQGVLTTIAVNANASPFCTGTSDSMGLVPCTINAAGSYYLTFSNSSFPDDRYNLNSRTLTLGTGSNYIHMSVLGGYICCPAIDFPIQNTLFGTVCSQSYTLNPVNASLEYAWSSGTVTINTAGVAVDDGTCTWSGYPNTTNGNTNISIDLQCPPNTNAINGFIAVGLLGHYNSVIGGYDAYALCPTNCSPTVTCQNNIVNLSGSINASIAVNGSMPLVDVCLGVSFPCAGQTLSVTS